MSGVDVSHSKHTDIMKQTGLKQIEICYRLIIIDIFLEIFTEKNTVEICNLIVYLKYFEYVIV